MSNDSPPPNSEGFPEFVLPEDVTLWPTVPEQILGVSGSASRKDVRRAYSRLIKRFRPEHFPEQFRRLREAYERVVESLQWKERFASFGFSVSVSDVDAAPVIDNRAPTPAPPGKPFESNSETERSHSEDPEWPTAGSDFDRSSPRAASKTEFTSPEEIWRGVITGGDVHLAYQALVRHAKDETANEIDFARLYWLGTLHPEIDQPRPPVSWVIEGMRRHRVPWQLLSLYAISVERHPEEIRTEPSCSLLELMFTENRIVRYAAIRWNAARLLGDFSMIQQDLKQLKRRLFDDLETWILLLLEAMQNAALNSDPIAAELYVSMGLELRAILEGNPSHHSWDGYEELNNRHEEWRHWRKRTQKPTAEVLQFVELIEQTWSCHSFEAERKIAAYCQEVLNTEQKGLPHWNLLARSCRQLLLKFLELLQNQYRETLLRSDDETFLPRAELEQWTKLIVRRFGGFTQVGVLEFCLAESVSPDDIANTIDDLFEVLPGDTAVLSNSLREDLALRVAVAAGQLVG